MHGEQMKSSMVNILAVPRDLEECETHRKEQYKGAQCGEGLGRDLWNSERVHLQRVLQTKPHQLSNLNNIDCEMFPHDSVV